MSTTQTTLVNTSVKNGVMTFELTFDPGNCYTHEMMRQLDEAILKARFDEAVQVIVIRGSGEKFFCAGAEGERANVLRVSERKVGRRKRGGYMARTRRVLGGVRRETPGGGESCAGKGGKGLW